MDVESKIRNFKAISDLDKINIDNDRLILYAIYTLEQKNIEATFDKVVVTAFRLFPKRFALIGFPEFPDGKRVHDCLFHCTYKNKKWLIGNAQSGFKISDKGKYYLEETKKIMDKEIELPKKYRKVVKRKERTVIDSLKNTRAFKKYSEGNWNKVSKEEIAEALRVFKYANRKDIEKNLLKYISYAKILEDKSALEFLLFIKKKGIK